jgi:hypothetical protein
MNRQILFGTALLGVLLSSGWTAAEDKKSDATGASLSADFRSTEGYRDARWGMTMEEVKKVAPDAQASWRFPTSLVVFNDRVAGKPARVVFRFAEDRLIIVMVQFMETHPDSKSKYVNDYDEIEKVLTTKYGEPEKKVDDWSGHLIKFIAWSTDKTDVQLACRGDDRELGVTIRYASREFDALMKRIVNETKSAGP